MLVGLEHRFGAPALLCFLAVTAAVADAPPGPALAAAPQVEFRELFAAVQLLKVFPDGKTFADALPNEAPERILASYREEAPRSPDALRRFVIAHFSLPPDFVPAPSAAGREPLAAGQEPLTAHIDGLWDALTHSTPSVPPYSSLLALPQPYVVPGGRFREMYYWDSYFTMLGLKRSGRNDLAQDMAADFAHLIDVFGHVPNGTRTYYLSRSQPPLFFKMVGLLAAGNGSSPTDSPAAFARYLPQLRREHAFWMQGAAGLAAGSARLRVVALADGSILNRYWDDRDTPRDEAYAEDTALARSSRRAPRALYRDIRAAAESGWDFSSRWFADARHRATIDTTEIVPVDLNSLLYGLERAIAMGCRHNGDAPCTLEFERRAQQRRAAMDRLLWDAQRGAYLDYRWTHRVRVPRISAATLYPLFTGEASDSQAAAVAHTTSAVLLKAGGIVTTALATGQQWDAPNGWAPLQWIAIDGLRRYGQAALAATIACRWMSGVNRVYQESGKLVEKYDVVDTGRRGGGGEYPTQDGFGWTNGVMRELAALYPERAAYDAAGACPP